MTETSHGDARREPARYRELLAEIDRSFLHNDTQTQEKVFKSVFDYVRENTAARHWFCDEYMFPFVMHLMIVFSFPPSDVSRWIRARIEASVEQCPRCHVQYHVGKAQLRTTLLVRRAIAVPQATKFIEIIDAWEGENALKVLQKPAAASSASVSFAILSCLLNPNLVRVTPQLQPALARVFESSPQLVPSPQMLLPAMVFFLREGTLEQRAWAKRAASRAIEQPNCAGAQLAPFLQEFERWHYDIQDAKFFSPSQCIAFWECFLLVVDGVDEATLLGDMNAPPDLEVMSVYRNLRLYPLMRVLCNHLMSYLSEPLPAVLRVFARLLVRLGSRFWAHILPFTFANVLDAVVQNPSLPTFVANLPADAVEGVLGWMEPLVAALAGSQRQTAGVKLGVFALTQRGHNEAASRSVGCRLLAECMRLGKAGELAGEPGAKAFGVELLRRRDSRAAVDTQAAVVVAAAASGDTGASGDSDGAASVAALDLLTASLEFDLISLAHSSKLLQTGVLPTSFDTFPLLWMELLKVPATGAVVGMVVEVMKAFGPMSGIIRFEPKKANLNDKAFSQAIEQHNVNVGQVLGFVQRWLEKTGLVDPGVLRERLFSNEAAAVAEADVAAVAAAETDVAAPAAAETDVAALAAATAQTKGATADVAAPAAATAPTEGATADSAVAAVGYWSCVFSPLTNQAAVDILYQVFDDEGSTGAARLDSIRLLLHHAPSPALRANASTLARLSDLGAFEPCPKAVRILMDVVDALADPLNGVLISPVGAATKRHLQRLWQEAWRFLVMIYKGALVWATQYSIDKMIEFTRDTLDFSRRLLDAFMLVLEATGAPAAPLFHPFMDAFNHVIVWLRLGDVSLLNSCVELVFKGFDLARDLGIEVEEAFLVNFTKYGAKAKKFNNKLSESQRLDIISKAREFDPELVERVMWEVQEQRQKQPPPQPPSRSQSPQLKPPDAVYKYQTHAKQPRQQTLGRFGVVTREPPVAPAPAKAPSSSLEAIRKSLQTSRATPTASAASAAPAVAPAPPRPAGFNSKKEPVVGRSLNALKKRRDSDSSEEDEDGGSVDLSDLFVERKKKAKVVEVDIRGNPLVRQKLSVARQQSERRRREEYMRLRLNVNLKPLYSTILRWNYNSSSEFPTRDTDVYRPTKDRYEDAKDYVKSTEPLLMLECWQGIQSAKQTGQETPFELLIGSRSSCDGFFDVYASVRKDVLQDRKVGESDLVVLTHLEAPMAPRELVRHINAPQTVTCLAKVREIKSANIDFADITVRVYPQGSMMGVLTPKSVVQAMKVMQMVTVEREFSSLKGVQYYDLAQDIFDARPQEPRAISDAEFGEMERRFGVNRSQAQAILGTFEREGFSLIQGPPGTGKTKTILGIVGYYLSKKSPAGVIEIGDAPSGAKADTSAGTGPKVLVCAPSNAAVDELVLRLRQGVRNLQGETFSPKVVRIGRSDAINAAVRDLTLEELVDKQLQARAASGSTATDPAIREEHTKCVAERNALRQKLASPELKAEEVAAAEAQLRSVNKRKNELAKRLDEQRERVSIAYRTREIERRQAQAKILTEAQIICATLSGSAHDFLASLSMQFDQVIIDEACQCVELSAIIPLRYGCTQCIMVGDPNQLPPTVLSQRAASLNYEQSLFVRMQRAHPQSVYLLDVQYRMHPQISQFPSREFYHSRLHDGPGMLEANTRPWHSVFPLTPYRFFDVVGKHQQSAQTKSLYNHAEAEVVLEMVEELMRMLPKVSGVIGVISPYKEQIRTLKTLFRKKYGVGILNEIDFNTVDGYQGQEKEIIIMSCVRASPSGSVGFLSDVRRMNVALTRARTSLWILGNKDSLKRNKVWARLLEDAEGRGEVTQAYPGFLRRVKAPSPAAPPTAPSTAPIARAPSSLVPPSVPTVPARDVATRDVPPRDVPPRDVPPRNVPPRDVPPRNVPPRDAPPAPREPAPRVPTSRGHLPPKPASSIFAPSAPPARKPKVYIAPAIPPPAQSALGAQAAAQPAQPTSSGTLPPKKRAGGAPSVFISNRKRRPPPR
ncbi:UvrD-like helicase ATP-binding domain-containing protein [[Candida] zeylanoides]